MIQKVFGPPGTGKTTKLLNLVDDYIAKGVPLDRIGYFAFTRKAANEARDRFLEKHPGKYKQKEVRFFQTLHSLAFHTLGMSEDNVMDSVHYELVCEEMGIHAQSLDEGYALKSDNEYFRLLNKARVKKISVEDEYNTGEWSSDIDLTTLLYIEKNFNQFKEFNHLDDYTDMLEKLVKVPNKFPQFDVVFIDEAQDLAPIQWDIFDILKEKSKDIYLAGDDDQAIFMWAGADVERFVTQEADRSIVLDQSRRVPSEVLELSKIITERIEGVRQPKEYKPREVEGSVNYIYSLDGLDLSEGSWLILGRTNYVLDKTCKYLKSMNQYFSYNKHPYYGKSYNTKLFKCARLWTELTKGEEISLSDFKDIQEYLDKDYEIDTQVVRFTQLKHPKIKWYEAFVNAPEAECEYIRILLENGESLKEEPRIKVSTIHAAKGGEADNVILILNQNDKIREAVRNSLDKQDEEHRVWYVGVTRTKENLFLLKANPERKGYPL